VRPVFPRLPLNRADRAVPTGQVFVIPERCKGCNFCVELCPRDVLVESADMNARGYHYPVVAPGKEDRCADCRFCMLVCPEFAIFTVQRAEAVTGG
jgi:2-oxoglutarate ferredoxin oxidoreductase subunit delta